MESILIESHERFVVHPIIHQDLWDIYKDSLRVFWTVEEINFSTDKHDWDVLDEKEKNFLSVIIGFFAASDGIVNENIVSQFYNEVQYAEARAFYAQQIMMETIHSEVYSTLITTYISNEKERYNLLNGIITIPSIKAKADWAMKWMNQSDSFVKRLFAFAIIEGIFFSGSFASIFWIKTRGILLGLTTSNEFIARDEGFHVKFACLVYNNHIRHKLPRSEIEEMVKSAVEIEKYFFNEVLPDGGLTNMTTRSMHNYIEYVADCLLLMINEDPIYRTSNPFPFMENISLIGKDNFFEKRSSNYIKFTNTTDTSFKIDEDF